MKYELVQKAVEIIKRRVLTPVIYMSEYEDWVEYICFCDGKITVQELYETECELKSATGIDSEIADIREFSKSERVEITENCELIHSENYFTEKMLEASVLSDYEDLIREKDEMLERHRSCGTYYLQ